MVFIGGSGTDAKFGVILDGVDFKDGDITDTQNSNTIYDESNQYVPNAILESDSILVSSGDGITADSSVSLDSTLNISASPSDFTGSFLGTSGTPPDINVQIGSGLEGDGAGNIRPKTDSSLTLSSGNLAIDTSNSNSFSASQTFSSGIEVNANITDGTTTVYDSSNSVVPSSVIPDSLSFTKVSVDTLSNNNNSRIDFEVGSTKRAELDNSGDLNIEGSLTEGATL